MNANTPSRPTSLYIFILSDRADVYINSIGHCIGQYGKIKTVLVDILEDKGRIAESDQRLKQTVANINAQLQALAVGMYNHSVDENGQPKSKTIGGIQEFHKTRYKEILQIIKEEGIKTRSIALDELAFEVRTAAADGAVFDASAVSKYHLAQLFSTLSTTGNNGLFVFEILTRGRRRSYDEKELIHNLTLNKDYTFRDLVGEYQNASSAEILRRVYVNDIAKSALLLCAMVIFIPTSWIALAVIFIEWDRIEWFTFLVLGLPILTPVSFILAAFGIDFRFNPLQIRAWATTWAASRLEKKHAMPVKALPKASIVSDIIKS